MDANEIRTFCERYARAWERSDVDALVDCYSDDCEVVSPIFNVMSGKAQIAASFRELFRAFSDHMVEVEDVIVDQGTQPRAVLLFSTFGVHKGEIFGVQGTGRRFEVRGAFVFTFENGKIVKDTRIYDFTGMLMQLGILRAKAS
jgi:steroid delta-isomerase-like uncharacterized protein